MHKRISSVALAAVMLSACAGGARSVLPAPGTGGGSNAKMATLAFILKVPGPSVQTKNGRKPLYVSRDTKGIGVNFQTHSGSGFANATADTAPKAGMAVAPGGAGQPCTAAASDGSYSCTVYIAGVPVGHDDFRFTLWNAVPASCAPNGTGCSFSGDKAIAVQTLNDYAIIQGQNNLVPLTATFDPVVDSIAVSLSAGIADGAASTLTANTVFKDAQGDIILTGDQLLDDTGANLTTTLNISNDGSGACASAQLKSNSCSLYFGTSGAPQTPANPTIAHATDAAASETITYDGATQFPSTGSVPSVTASAGGAIYGANIAATLQVTSATSGSLGVPAAPQVALHPSVTAPAQAVYGSDSNLYVENKALTYAYVVDQGANDVQVVNLSTGAVAKTIPLAPGSAPSGIAISPDGSRVYVANPGANTVSVIDTATNGVLATVSMGASAGPVGVAVRSDGAEVFVAENSGNVGVIDASSNTLTRTFSLGAGTDPQYIVIRATTAYVTEYGANSVAIINTSTLVSTAISLSGGSGPVGIAASRDGNYVYVSDQGSGNVTVISTPANTVLATLTVGSSPTGIDVTPDSAHVYVANRASGTVNVITTGTSPSVSATITVGGSPNFVNVSPDGANAYVSNGSNVDVIDTTTNAPGTPIAGFSLAFGGAFRAIQAGMTQVTTGGTATAMALGSTAGDAIGGVAAGSDSYLWYTDTNANAIDRQAPCGAGCPSTTATWATSGAISGASLGAITAGPDGNMWFPDAAHGNLDDIAPSAMTSVNTLNIAGGIGNANLAAGTFADGDRAICYGTSSNAAVGCRDLSSSTTSTTNYTLADGGTLTAMAFGPDGVLYVASSLRHVYGLISSGGGSTVALNAGFTYGLSSAGTGMTLDSEDAAVWITEGTGTLARLQPESTGNPPAVAGTLKEYALSSVFNASSTSANLNQIVPDGSGALWASDTGLNQLDQITIHP